MRLLVIGGGGREHALCYSISISPLLTKLFAIPGNPGISKIAQCHDLDLTNNELICQFCLDKAINFVIIGPEQPLANGIVDALAKHDIVAFGPTAAAARLEVSKAFTKELCSDYNIPTASYQCFTDIAKAKIFAKNSQFPLVIKADGLAAGKGVIIANNLTQAEDAIDLIAGDKFGSAGSILVIEEFLVGPEISFFALSDGNNAKFFAAAQDYKRAYDGDVGPNTGGMGSISPSPLLNAALQQQVMAEIIAPTIKAMQDKNTPFKGMLFAGLILTKDGPKLLEYNTRFGDPETESMLLTIESDLLEILYNSATGALDKCTIKFNGKKAISVIMASKGYPEKFEKGSVIKELSDASKVKDVIIFHAGTKEIGKDITASGGRVLAISATGESFSTAATAAYQAVQLIDWEGGFYRTDIGKNKR
jgi:phosphoribosylamine--glycine ligase